MSGELPIAVRSGVEYVLHESRLAAGDQLVMYTDGISEARKRPSCSTLRE